MGNGKFIAEKLNFGFLPTGHCVNEFGHVKWYRVHFETQEQAETAVLLKLKNDANEAESIRYLKKQNRIVKIHKKLP